MVKFILICIWNVLNGYTINEKLKFCVLYRSSSAHYVVQLGHIISDEPSKTWLSPELCLGGAWQVPWRVFTQSQQEYFSAVVHGKVHLLHNSKTIMNATEDLFYINTGKNMRENQCPCCCQNHILGTFRAKILILDFLTLKFYYHNGKDDPWATHS